MKNAMLSVMAVSRMLLPITGSRPNRSRIIGHSTPTADASSMFNTMAPAITPASASEP